MKRSLWIWQLMGFAVTSLGGTVLHFLYDWLGKPAWIAPFSGVNESTWEHMKLLFWPMLIFAVFESLFHRNDGEFWCVKRRGIALGLVLIPVLFYTYNGVIGKSPDFVNIAIFFVSAAAAYFYEAKLFKNTNRRYACSGYAFLTLLLLGGLFAFFTFNTPNIGIFRDPLTGGYGIQ